MLINQSTNQPSKRASMDEYEYCGALDFDPFDSVVPGKCQECGAEYDLEPDGTCECQECGTLVESELLRLGLI